VQFKARLRKAYAAAKSCAPEGQVSTAAFLGIMYDTIRAQLQGRPWGRAFDECGYEPGQVQATKYILDQMNRAVPPEVGHGRPSLEQLTWIYPKGSVPPMGTLFPAVRQPLARLQDEGGRRQLPQRRHQRPSWTLLNLTALKHVP